MPGGPATGKGLEDLLNTVGYKIRYGMTPEEYKKWAAMQEVPEPYRADPNVADRYLGTKAATTSGLLPDVASELANQYALGDVFLSPAERDLTKEAGRAGMKQPAPAAMPYPSPRPGFGLQGAAIQPAQDDGIMAMIRRIIESQGQ